MVLSVVTTVSSLCSLALYCALHYKLFAPISARGQNTAPSSSGRAGATPRQCWAAESRTQWGRSRPSLCFVRVQMSPVSFTHPPFFQEAVVGPVRDLGTEAAPEVPRTCQPSPHLLLLSPNTASWPGTVTARNRTFCVAVLVVSDSARKSFGNCFRLHRRKRVSNISPLKRLAAWFRKIRSSSVTRPYFLLSHLVWMSK